MKLNPGNPQTGLQLCHTSTIFFIDSLPLIHVSMLKKMRLNRFTVIWVTMAGAAHTHFTASVSIVARYL